MKLLASLWLLAWPLVALSQETVLFTPEQQRADLAVMESALVEFGDG